MKIFARTTRIASSLTSLASFALAALALTACTADANEPEPTDVAAPATRIDPHGESFRDGDGDLQLSPAVLAAVLEERKNPELVGRRDRCSAAGRHWSVLERTCFDADSPEALADRCRFDGGVMKDGGCTFSGSPVEAPTKVDAPLSPAPATRAEEGRPLCTQVDVTGACKVDLPRQPVAIGCASPTCD